MLLDSTRYTAESGSSHRRCDKLAETSRGFCNVRDMATINFNESTTSVPPDESALIVELRDRLTEATIKCSERCLYQSAKWFVVRSRVVFD